MNVVGVRVCERMLTIHDGRVRVSRRDDEKERDLDTSQRKMVGDIDE
jgi:hypothetical protein